MEKLFEKLRDHFGSHKKAAEHLRVSYTRYNEWRWHPDKMPAYAKHHVELAVKNIEQKHDQ